MPTRNASAEWKGGVKGQGSFRGKTGLSGQYSYSSRFENGAGSNPEELLAAAHASCFSMAFANELNKAGKPAERITVNAVCHADRVNGSFTILAMDLEVSGRVPNIDRKEFERVAEVAKVGCPVSGALANNIEIRLKALHLED